MARNPIYPTSAGETAVDRLLNQTLPRIIADKQDRDDRAQQRQDTLDARKQSQDNFEKNFTYVTGQDRLKEDNRKDEKIIGHFAKATSYSLTGNDEEAETEYQQGVFWAEKYGRNAADFGSDTSRIKIDKVRGINDTYENNFTVFNSLNPNKDQVTTANRNILNIYNDLTDSQKAEYRFKIKSSENDESFVGIQMSENELEFFSVNSKLYDQTLGKKSGFDSLPETQKDAIVAQLPTDQQFLSPDATNKQKLERQKNIDSIYKASGLYKSETDLAKKYVTDTVNQYGSWESLSQEINGMNEFNRDLHIERLGLGLVKSGAVKGDKIESYLLKSGISQETLDASAMFKEEEIETTVQSDIKVIGANKEIITASLKGVLSNKEIITASRKGVLLEDYTSTVNKIIDDSDKDFKRGLELQKKLESSKIKDKSGNPIQTGTEKEVKEYNELKKKFGFTRFSPSFSPQKGYNQLRIYKNSLIKERDFYKRNPLRLGTKESKKGSILRGTLEGQDPSTRGRFGYTKGPGALVTSTGHVVKS